MLLTNIPVYSMMCRSCAAFLKPWTLRKGIRELLKAETKADVDLGVVRDAGQAAALLHHPARLRILAAMRTPGSATGVARDLHLPRQTVNYHVRELARAKFLQRAGRRKRRRMYEQLYVASARGYVLSGELLGGLAADPEMASDKLSAGYLIALAGRMQSEVEQVQVLAVRADKRLATLSLSSDLRFTSAGQRAAFASELQRAIIEVVARRSAPYREANGAAGKGRGFRLVVGCYPILEQSVAREENERILGGNEA